MKAKESDWYRKVWTLNIQNQSWVENTKREVDFLIDRLHLRKGERILDLACGFGRHSLELARRGFRVMGVDITPDYIRYAQEQAQKEGLNAEFFCSDIRQVKADGEYDAVLNMADGAVGYLESDEENHKIFEVVARALKPGGRHFMDIMSGSYAQTHFPCTSWEAGEKGLTLSKFEWNEQTCTLIYAQLDYPYGTPLPKPEMEAGDPIRLYTLDEIRAIYAPLGMKVTGCYSEYDGKPALPNKLQMLVCSEKCAD